MSFINVMENTSLQVKGKALVEGRFLTVNRKA
jgi:hypothetical protein